MGFQSSKINKYARNIFLNLEVVNNLSYAILCCSIFLVGVSLLIVISSSSDFLANIDKSIAKVVRFGGSDQGNYEDRYPFSHTKLFDIINFSLNTVMAVVTLVPTVIYLIITALYSRWKRPFWGFLIYICLSYFLYLFLFNWCTNSLMKLFFLRPRPLFTREFYVPGKPGEDKDWQDKCLFDFVPVFDRSMRPQVQAILDACNATDDRALSTPSGHSNGIGSVFLMTAVGLRWAVNFVNEVHNFRVKDGKWGDYYKTIKNYSLKKENIIYGFIFGFLCIFEYFAWFASATLTLTAPISRMLVNKHYFSDTMAGLTECVLYIPIFMVFKPRKFAFGLSTLDDEEIEKRSTGTSAKKIAKMRNNFQIEEVDVDVKKVDNINREDTKVLVETVEESEETNLMV